MGSQPSVHPVARELLVERRRFLRAAGAGAAIVAGGGLSEILAGCSSGGGSTAGDRSSATTVPRPAPGIGRYDPNKRWWEQGNYLPVTEERTETALRVTGSLPSDLRGLYVRNGSNTAGAATPFWFLGDGMLHGVHLDGGKASWYRNRWVDTPLQRDRRGFQVPGRTENQSNISLVHHGGRLLSLGEVGWPYQIDPADLSTVGPYDFAGKLGPTMTAHPKIDPVTGRLHFFGYSFAEPFLTYYAAEPDGTLSVASDIALPRSTMMHDFAITDRDVVFWDCPVVFGKFDPALPNMPYAWDPSAGTRIGILPLGGSGDQVRWVTIPDGFVFHGVNAHREGDQVVVTVSHLDRAFDGPDLFGTTTLRRWRIDTSGPALTFAEEVLDDRSMDLPNIDRRRTGRPVSTALFTTVDPHGSWGLEFAGIRQVDLADGSGTEWRPAGLEHAGEPTLVPTGDSDRDGWVLAFTYDRATDRSDLVVLDSTALAEGPVARVHLPVRVPYGFHGLFLADA